MTEAEWLEATDPTPLLDLLKARASDHKWRLLACACCRRIWHLLRDVRSQNAVEVAERYADGLADWAALDRARTEACSAADADYDARSESLTRSDPSASDGYWNHEICVDACSAAHACYSASSHDRESLVHALLYAAQGVAHATFPHCPDLSSLGSPERRAAEQREQGDQTALFRDIFGNPFRPVAVDPSWLTSTVVALAHQMYESRDFAPMPVLADALQDAGCDNEAILAHCRGAGPHVRGCWIVDLLLGKS